METDETGKAGATYTENVAYPRLSLQKLCKQDWGLQLHSWTKSS